MTEETYSRQELKALITQRADEFRDGLLSELEASNWKPDEEVVYSADLAIDQYPGKWEAAKEEAKSQLKEEYGVDYWLLARRFFLDTGGEYK